MKRNIFIFLALGILFIFVFPLKSYAYTIGGTVYTGYTEFHLGADSEGLSNDSPYAYYLDGSFIRFISKNESPFTMFLRGSANGTLPSGWSINSFYCDGPISVFSNRSSALAALNSFVPVPPSGYDDSIGVGGEFYILQSKIFSSAYLIKYGAYWKFDNVDHVKLVISGSKKTDEFELFGSANYWFEPTDYGEVNAQVVLYCTPYDSFGNWGNTMMISKNITNILTTPINGIKQAFNGYVLKETNNPDIEIVGIDNIDTVTIIEKPDTNHTVTNPTVLKTTTVYTPVYNTYTTENFTDQNFYEYVTNNNYSTNNYYTTNNYIDKNTNISISVNIDNDSSESRLTRYNNAKGFLKDAPDKILDSLSTYSGTPLEPILITIVTCFGVLIGAALVFVIIKIVGIIL